MTAEVVSPPVGETPVTQKDSHKNDDEPITTNGPEEEEEGEGSSTFNLKDDDTAATEGTNQTLESAISAKTKDFAKMVPKEVFEIYGRKIKEYAASPMFQYTIKVGDVFPDFSLQDETGAFCSSVDMLLPGSGNDYMIVTFFRGGWCGICNTQLEVYNRYVPQFQAKNAALVAIAPQQYEKNYETRHTMGLGYPLLSDEHCEFAQLCQVAYELDEELRPYSQHIPLFNGNDDWLVPIPATFVIRASDRKVLYSYYEVDPQKRAEPADILASIVSEEEETAKEKAKKQQAAKQAKEKKAAATAAAAAQQEGPVTLNDTLLTEVKRLEELELESEQPGNSSIRSIMREIRALKEAGIADAALKVGKEISPDMFKLPLATNPKKTYDMKKALKKTSGGGIVIVFIHGDWSPFCQITLKAWNDKYETSVQAKGAGLIAISPSPCKPEHDIHVDFPILWDEHNVVAKQFRLRYQMDAHLHGQTQAWPLPMTATYVIAVNNTNKNTKTKNPLPEIVYAHADCDHTKRADPATVIGNHVPPGKITYKKKRGAFSLRLKGWLPIGTSSKKE